MKLTPVNGHILVELPKKEEGIYIPEQLSDSQQEGNIVAIASDLGTEVNYPIGAKIRWEKFAEADGSFDYTLDGNKIRVTLIKAKQVMGVWG